MATMRTILVLMLVAALPTLASCGGSGLAPARQGADAFSIAVLPESFDVGGSAEVGLEVRQDGELFHVDVVARDAEGLKALYFELAYDREALHPVEATPTEALGAADELLSLAVLETPEVHFGVVVIHPQIRQGFSGTAPVARISFARGPADPSRSASLTTVTDRSVTTLTVNPGTGVLRWLYYNNGDYDQNREVNAADLTPIALHFGKTSGGGPFPPESIESVVDGDVNGEIAAADLAPIGGSFLRVVAQYNVYASATPAPYPTSNTAPSTISPVTSVQFAEAQGTGVRKFFTLGAPEHTYDPTMYYWVRPAHEGHEGTPSTLLNPQAIGNPPIINSINAVPNEIFEGETSTITVNATDPDGGDLTYLWNASIGNISGFGAVVTYNAPATVAAPTLATITVTVSDENNNETQAEVNVLVNPVPAFTVHISFTPAAHGGNGTTDTPYIVMQGDTYVFTAEDGDGNDITADVTFEAFPDDPSDPPFAAPDFVGTSMSIEHGFITDFHVIGTYLQGTPDEVSSNPNSAGEEMHFRMAANMPASL